ncbi:hypothetical protein AURDEDRAFT_115877 [Auricularia subglabra TFB-10046 SS5]|nr:hypothetical protein AURDEDRAFT_115877 [Auricularia subglabra TFB-10046 SS5]
MTRPSVLILLSVLCGFLAATIDSIRIFQTSNGDAASRALFIAQEPFVALSVFIRYLFFLEYATRSPDQTGTKNPRWSAWPVPRILCEAALLLVAVAIVALQMLWRFGIAGWRRICTVEIAFELGWTTLLLLKMGCAIVTCSDPAKRRKFAKTLFPILVALLIELGVSIGNAVARGFADRAAGRFLQAAEVYIILFALTGQAVARLIAANRAHTRTFSSEKSGGYGSSGSTFEVCLSRNPSAARSNYGTDEGLSRGPSLRDWLATRLPPREADLEKQPLPPAEAVDPVRPRDNEPSPSQALALLARHIVDTSTSPTSDPRASRVASLPPPTPAPQGPLPVTPPSHTPRDSAVEVDMDKRPVSSTFGHATTPRCSGIKAASPTTRANRCASAPAITATDASDAQSPRVLRAKSNPGGAAPGRVVETLLREKRELAAAYPDPRQSVVSAETREGRASTESDETYRPHSRVARESVRSEFSLSRFPPPPSVQTPPPLPQTSADVARLTVDTDPRRLTFGLPFGSRPASSATSSVGEKYSPAKPSLPPPRGALEPPEPVSAVSLAPSPPNMPRAPPRIRRKRTAESFATLAEPPVRVRVQEATTVPEPAARVRFAQQPSVEPLLIGRVARPPRVSGPQKVRLPVGVTTPVRVVNGLPVPQRAGSTRHPHVPSSSI